MWRWFRLFLLLALLGGGGILLVHCRTTVVISGYRISGLIEKREALKERNRLLRIELGRASVPSQIRESYKTMTSEGERAEASGATGGDDAAGRASRGNSGQSIGPDIGGGDDE